MGVIKLLNYASEDDIQRKIITPVGVVKGLFFDDFIIVDNTTSGNASGNVTAIETSYGLALEPAPSNELLIIVEGDQVKISGDELRVLRKTTLKNKKFLLLRGRKNGIYLIKNGSKITLIHRGRAHSIDNITAKAVMVKYMGRLPEWRAVKVPKKFVEVLKEKMDFDTVAFMTLLTVFLIYITALFIWAVK